MTRGGRRPGAGAPRGNLNALSSGRHVADRHLRDALRQTPEPARSVLIAALRRNNQTPVIEPEPSNVLPLHRPFHTTATAAAPEQSNAIPRELAALIGRLESYHFRGALDFVRRHHRYAGAVTAALEHLDDLDDDQYARILNTGGFIRDDVHTAISSPHAGLLRCPACRWSDQYTLTEKETGS